MTRRQGGNVPSEMASAGSGAKAWAERLMRSAGRRTSGGETLPGEDGGPAAVRLAHVGRRPGPEEPAGGPEQASAVGRQDGGDQGGSQHDAAERVDRRQLAQRVYGLMRHEMIVERERTTTSGG